MQFPLPKLLKPNLGTTTYIHCTPLLIFCLLETKLMSQDRNMSLKVGELYYTWSLVFIQCLGHICFVQSASISRVSALRRRWLKSSSSWRYPRNLINIYTPWSLEKRANASKYSNNIQTSGREDQCASAKCVWWRRSCRF